MRGRSGAVHGPAGDPRRVGFVGRRGPLGLFAAQLAAPDDPGRRRIMWIHGIGGVGKSTLVDELRQIAIGRGAVTAKVDDSVRGVAEALDAIATQFAGQGRPLKRFAGQVAEYRRARAFAELDAVPAGPASVVTRTAVGFGLHAARAIPGVGVVAGVADPMQLAEQADQFRGRVAHRLRRDGDPRPFLDPAEALSPGFAEALTQVAARAQIVLFFDTYERTGAFLDEWLQALLAGRYGPLPDALTWVLSGRGGMDPHRWGPLLPMVADVPVEPFSLAESREFLDAQQVTEPRVREVLLAVSDRLPLHLAMLADRHPDSPEAVGDFTGDAVDCFLRWEADPQLRALAVSAALPRWINRDVLDALTSCQQNTSETSSDGPSRWSWLLAQSFVTRRSGRCHYHEVVRTAMIRVARSESPARWRRTHALLAERHAVWRGDLGGTDMWADAMWHEHRLEEAYHRLCADPVHALAEALAGAVHAGRVGESGYGMWARMFEQAGTDAASSELRRWAERLTTALNTAPDGASAGHHQGGAARSASAGSSGTGFLSVLLASGLLSTRNRAGGHVCGTVRAARAPAARPSPTSTGPSPSTRICRGHCPAAARPIGGWVGRRRPSPTSNAPWSSLPTTPPPGPTWPGATWPSGTTGPRTPISPAPWTSSRETPGPSSASVRRFSDKSASRRPWRP